MSAETIVGLGVSFPFMNFLKNGNYTEDCTSHSGSVEYEIPNDYFDGIKTSGVQFSIKVRHIFDSRFVLGLDFDIGKSKLKINGNSDGTARYLDMNVDLAIGYAIVDGERLTMILSAIAGVHHGKADLGSIYGGVTPSYFSGLDGHYNLYGEVIERYTAFEIGGELFANFKIGDIAGLFASCKVMYNIGNMRDKYDVVGDEVTVAFHKTTAFVVKPSVGVSFTF